MTTDPLVVLDSAKPFERAAADLEAAVAAHGFGVLHVHDLRATLAKKGVELPEACRVLEVCNPQKAKAVLSEDMRLNTVLPCRISVWTEGGRTRLGTVRPTAILAQLSGSPALAGVAREVEDTVLAILADAR